MEMVKERKILSITQLVTDENSKSKASPQLIIPFKLLYFAAELPHGYLFNYALAP